MLASVSVLVGLLFFAIGIVWLWYIFARPKSWERFTKREHDFWVKRGLPITWAGAIKAYEQGRGLKVLVAFCILVAAVLTVAPWVLPHFFPTPR